jgi:hypothetical protein
MEMSVNEIDVNGVKYVPKDSSVTAPAPSGARAVVVIDRGWIFAGDVEDTEDGRIRLTRAVWILRWESIGFDGLLKDPKSSKATLRKLDHAVECPADAEVFRVPVDANWGL